MTRFHETVEGRAALSRAHSAEMVCILRLTNGNFALYDHAKHLRMIVGPDELIELVGAWPPFPPLRAPSRPKVDLSDLGIL